MVDYSEKRDFLRMDMDCSLEYSIEGDAETHTGQMKNLSANGIQFVSADAITVGSVVSVKLTPLNNITPPMSADVAINRCDSEGDQSFIVAGQILKIH